MSTTSEHASDGNAGADEQAPDDEETLAWPQPLSSEERSRVDANTWKWDAVTIYPGGTGPGVPFSTYARASEPQDAPGDAADLGAVDTDGADALDNKTTEVKDYVNMSGAHMYRDDTLIGPRRSPASRTTPHGHAP